MRLFRPGFLARCLYPEAIFRIKTSEKILYLTFDDGPDQGSTPQLLDILSRYKIKALFFCSGNAAEMNQALLKLIGSDGHMIGNHGYNHLDGWRTDPVTYYSDILKASGITSATIFRPPFGRLTLRQKSKVSESYKIVFWDIMAYDFDASFGRERSLRVLKKKIRPGSIIVLHDKESSCANAILEEFLVFARDQGYIFELLNVAGLCKEHSCLCKHLFKPVVNIF